MVKKLQKMAEKKSASAAGLLDSQLASTVKDSAQQIWLAGLGAFSKAQEEGGKLFETLIKEGVSLQRKTQAQAEEKITQVTGKMSAMAGDVTSKAGQHWDKLESIFESRVSKAMSKLGVPSAKEIDALNKRIDALAAQVAKLGKAPAAKKTAAKTEAFKFKAAATNGAAKPAAKRGAARKTAAFK
jgi:poly(hydroxyalkanoate) granule-associated protein